MFIVITKLAQILFYTQKLLSFLKFRLWFEKQKRTIAGLQLCAYKKNRLLTYSCLYAYF